MVANPKSNNMPLSPVDENGHRFFDVHYAPFSLEGMGWKAENQGAFYRLPPDLAPPAIHPNEITLAHYTAGLCVRFRSDSPEVFLRVKFAPDNDKNQLRSGALRGFDTYRREPGGPLLHNRTLAPERGLAEVTAECGRNRGGRLCDWLVNFPAYRGVESLEVGLLDGSVLLPPPPHRIAKPILFYGSSITQGTCASRPGNAFTSLLCRAVDAELINLGFSGNAIGEPALARAIASLDLAAFVLDYDHNAYTTDELAQTHEPFFRIVRDAHPNLPILILSMCDFRTYSLHTNKADNAAAERREVIRQTYLHARDNGDQNVYFIDGETLFGDEDVDACTADTCHPNDLGFYRMYRTVLPVLRHALHLD